MKAKTLDDVMICPNCKSKNCYEYGTDEIEFNANGVGHYYVDCHCSDCQKDFRLYANFDYSITSAYTRNQGKRGHGMKIGIVSKSRYIDADVLMAQVIKKKPEVAKARWTEGFNDAIMRVRSMIHSAATVDVVEVRHGEWKKTITGIICSVCDTHEARITSYCPNCGAKMDGERREQNGT